MKKISDLIQWFNGKGTVLIAVSGGVDSALVAYAASQNLRNSAIAVTADYKTLSKDELDSAKKICKEIGIKHLIIEYDELENENFTINDKNRCFYCRQELSTHLKKVAIKFEADIIVDGTNLDDFSDYRPGMKAMIANGVKSPLVETRFTKKQVRDEAKRVGLSVYDRPSNSCLASRVPWGQKISQERLARIENGEFIVKQILGAKQVRVRDLDGVAKIEIGNSELQLFENKTKLQAVKTKLQQIGFKSVSLDPDGYRHGKFNVINN